MQRNSECGIVRRVRSVAGKTTNEEKTVEKSADIRKTEMDEHYKR